ncbi:hypothetical protein EYF80_006438 [Liparis tanakae]|uniref:Uncharacterized protein n=1 Tax=Liparis tanakae TaxID=230148 RepID=A0A4Z2J0B3_9TELE|nr:hypothetical protein EYF80_006438 [Liparis tanakae]
MSLAGPDLVGSDPVRHPSRTTSAPASAPASACTSSFSGPSSVGTDNWFAYGPVLPASLRSPFPVGHSPPQFMSFLTLVVDIRLCVLRSNRLSVLRHIEPYMQRIKKGGGLSDCIFNVLSLLRRDGGMGSGALVRHQDPKQIPAYPKDAWRKRREKEEDTDMGTVVEEEGR